MGPGDPGFGKVEQRPFVSSEVEKRGVPGSAKPNIVQSLSTGSKRTESAYPRTAIPFAADSTALTEAVATSLSVPMPKTVRPSGVRHST